MDQQTLDAFEELRKCFGPDAVLLISRCNPEDQPICSQCSKSKEWVDCVQCLGKGIPDCLCEGTGGNFHCSAGCKSTEKE